MDIHQNARLTFFRREQLARRVLVEQQTLSSAAAEFKVCFRTAAKWVRRFQQEGPPGSRIDPLVLIAPRAVRQNS